jgi:hypothetical protein
MSTTLIITISLLLSTLLSLTAVESIKKPVCSPATLDNVKLSYRVSGDLPLPQPTKAPVMLKKGKTATPTKSVTMVHRNAIGYMILKGGKIITGYSVGKMGNYDVTRSVLGGNYSLAADCRSVTMDVTIDGRVVSHLGLRDDQGVIRTVQTQKGTSFIGEFRPAKVGPCSNATLANQVYIYNGYSSYRGDPFAFLGNDEFDGKGNLITHYHQPSNLNQIWKGKYSIDRDTCMVNWYYDSGDRYVGILWEKDGYYIVNITPGFNDIGTSYLAANRP